MATKKKATPTATAEADALLAEDAAKREATPDMLARIVEATSSMQRLEQENEQLAQRMATNAAEHRRLSEQVLPALMDEAGLPELFVDEDTKAVKGEGVFASISAANTNKAVKWLVDKGYADIVKMEFKIPVDKGDVVFAERVRKFLSKAKLVFAERSAIHPQTLNAFVRESLEKGRKLPAAITYHVQPAVVLKKVKPKKSAQRAVSKSI